jgi:hypothetical protein
MGNVSDKNCRENRDKHSMFGIPSSRKPCSLRDNVEKYVRARHAADDFIIYGAERCDFHAG